MSYSPEYAAIAKTALAEIADAVMCGDLDDEIARPVVVILQRDLLAIEGQE